MIAYSTASGGAMFLPDVEGEKAKSISYSDLLNQQDTPRKERVFGKKKARVDVVFPVEGVVNI